MMEIFTSEAERFFQDKPVFVTGGGGFIGSHLVERLAELGARVTAFVRYNGAGSTGWLSQLRESPSDRVKIHYGDIVDSASVRDGMKGCDLVFHLAALISIPYSYDAPLSYIRTNIEGTYNVLQAARDFAISRVVHTSTSEVYGSAQYVPMDENHPLVGQSPYAASKIGADQLAISFYRSFGTPVTIVRPFNAYGPRQSTRAVIPTIILQLLLRSGSLQLGSTHPTRDFTFVEDTVNGFLSCAMSRETIGEVVNLGSGLETSVRDIAQTIARALEVPCDFGEVADLHRVRPEPSEVNRLLASTNKAKELTLWHPRYAGRDGLERGILRTIDWYRQNRNLLTGQQMYRR